MQSMAMLVTSFLLLVLSTCVSLCHCSGAQIYIEPGEGEQCPQNASSCLNVTAFGSMADNFSNSSDMIVYFLEGTHLLDLPGLVVFRGLHNAVFEGCGKMEQGFHETVWQSTVVIKCTKSSGIAFVNSSNVTFKSITVTNCGANALDLNQTVTGKNLCNATLLFFRVASITIDHASIQNGSGYGLLVASDGFEITITFSSFAQNSASCESNCSGGNVILFYVDPPPGAEMNQTHKTHISRTNITLGIGGHNAKFVLKPEVGGLGIYMEHTKYNMEIFIDHVKAFGTINGSNIQIFTTPHVLSYNLTINNTVSTHAHPVRGGLFIFTGWQRLYELLNDHTGSTNSRKIFILNSKFSNNSASYGGGILFGKKSEGYSIVFVIESTEISNNIAKFGSGMYLGQTVFNTYETVWNVTLNNVTINNNTNKHSHKRYGRYKSAVYASLISYLKLNKVSITNNNSTGLLAIATKVLVDNKGESLFYNNSGVDGGGLHVYEDSILMLEAGAHLIFTDNHATSRGGAMFVEGVNHPIVHICFFQYADYNFFGSNSSLPSATIYFSGNEANVSGSVLYGGDIDNCYLSTHLSVNVGHVFNSTFNYSDQTGPSVIASDPSQVCFCRNDTPDCSLDTLNMSAYPGEKITVPVVTVGQRNGVVPGTILLQGDHSQELSSQPHNINGLKCKNISITTRYTGAAVIKNKVVLTDTQSSKELHVTVLKCPLGFNVSNTTKTCDCTELKQDNNPRFKITCDGATQRISRKGGGWIGFDNTSNCTVLVAHCPFDYCVTSEVTFSLTDPDPQCALNRTGTLCGNCQDGLSLALGSNNCIQCHDSSHIALILPFAAAGIGLVALLMVLNLTVSAGTINGLVFYASTVKLSSLSVHLTIPVLSQFISWLNLDLGIEMCFFSGTTAYAKVWLQFVFPLYIWVIIATIIFLCRYSTWLSNKVGGNVVPVLATLTLLSYTKLIRTIALVLNGVSLPCTSSGRTRTVWYMDGTVEYFSWQHTLLFFVAFVFLLLAVLYTFVLLFDTLIEKHLTKVRLFQKRWIKFKPLVDAYNGPYKDRYRFWTGLLLLTRLVLAWIASSGTINPNYHDNVVMALNTIAVILPFLIAISGGIYQKRHLNILEYWSLLNLAVVSSFATTQQKNIVIEISVSLMFTTFVAILLYHTFLRLQHVECLRKVLKFWNSKGFKCNKRQNNKVVTSMKESLMSRESPTPIEMCLRRESLIEFN